jgi:murein DD-endopeptidase MepM/ murein hydrolase activator NlpD
MKRIIAFFILFILITSLTPEIQADTIKPYLVTEPFEQNVSGSIRVYFVKTIPVEYKSGKVVLSLNADGTGEALVGESIDVSISYPGDGSFERINTNSDCSIHNKMAPLDISHLLHQGLNNIQVRYRRVCFPGIKKADQLYLVHFDDYEPTAEPFLDLPWDYAGKGQSFEDAALKIESFFDHQYPLISTNLQEPTEFASSIVKYTGELIDKPYTTHDGYDYAFNSNVKLNDPVIAAAPGKASYVNSCGPCGNAIHINHGNGYQTRYYHLQPDGLITNNPTEEVSVANRQKIGKVGLTGRTDGAHIHFMVVKDKNNDGNFDDNIPDGLIDPYGWQSNTPDPWEYYQFELFDNQKTGAKSHYMWNQNIPGIKKTLHADGETFNTTRHTITFPKEFTLKDLILSLKSIGVSDSSNMQQSIGHGIDITLWDGINTFITQFQKNFTLKFNFGNIDTTRINQESISMYSSIDGINWQKESTTIDWQKLEATMQANHLTKFALFGEKLDSLAPTTTALLSGTEVTVDNQTNTYSSQVNLILSISDEPVEHSLGIDYTLYKINDGEWKIYEEPLQFTEQNTYNLQYYSIDKDGNTENIQTTEFSIIEINNPELLISYDFEIEDFIITPDPITLPLNSEITKKKKRELNIYTVTSDNKSTSITTQSKRNPNHYILKIIALNYNNEVIPIEKEKLSVEFIKNSNKKGNKIRQTFAISDTIKMVLLYSENQNITKITIQEHGNEKEIHTVDGFKQFIISTNKGALHYSIQ